MTDAKYTTIRIRTTLVKEIEKLIKDDKIFETFGQFVDSAVIDKILKARENRGRMS